MTIVDADRRRAMAAGFAAIALWGALATLSVSAGPIPPFQMVAMTFAVGAAIGIVRALARGVGWAGLVGWPARVWLLGVGGLFGYHALYFAALQLAPPAEANLVNYLWPLLIVLLSAPLAGERLGWPHLLGRAAGLRRRRAARLRSRRAASPAPTRWAMRWRWAAPSPGRSIRCCRAASARRRPTPSPPSARHRPRCRSSAICCSSARCGRPRRRRGSPCWRSASARPAPRSISGTTPSSAATSARWARCPMPRRSSRRRS